MTPGPHPSWRALPCALATLLVAALFAGCVSVDEDGRVSFYVKDAVADDFRHVNVTFSKVEIHRGAGGGNESGSWLTVVSTTHTVDLLAYSEASSRYFLGNGTVGAGHYTQIRVQVDQAAGITSAGEQVTLVVPSGTLKIVRGFNVSGDENTRIVIDLDLERSIKMTGQGAYRLTPVVGKTSVEEDATGPDASVADPGALPEPSEGEATEGPLTVYIKDAPTDEFREIWIAFSEVSVHRSGQEDGDGTDEEDNATTGNGTGDPGNGTSNDTEPADGGSWSVVFTGNRSVDLLNFSDAGSKAFLGNATLPTGKYTQIRLNVTEAWGITPDGARINITVANPTAKVNRPFAVGGDNTTQLVIDIDLDRSLHRQGGPQSDTWRLTPVIGSVMVNHVEDDAMTDEPDSAA